MGTAASLALGAGSAIGVALSAYPRRRPTGVFAALHAVPPYILTHALVFVFSLSLGLFPVAGLQDPRPSAARGLALIAEQSSHLVLPVAALALNQLRYTALLVRVLVAEEMREAYMVAAMARGRSRGEARGATPCRTPCCQCSP